jgi:hypothetical protein
MVVHVILILNIPIVDVLHLGMVYFVIFVNEKSIFYIFLFSIYFSPIEYYQILVASNLSFTSDFYFDTLNSPPYINLTNDLSTWLNNAFSSLPSTKIYSVNFVA